MNQKKGLQIDPYGVAPLNKQLKLNSTIGSNKTATQAPINNFGNQANRMTSAMEGHRHEIGNSVLFDQNAVEAGILTRTTSAEKLKDQAASKSTIAKKPSSSNYGVNNQQIEKQLTAGESSTMNFSGQNQRSGVMDDLIKNHQSQTDKSKEVADLVMSATSHDTVTEVHPNVKSNPNLRYVNAPSQYQMGGDGNKMAKSTLLGGVLASPFEKGTNRGRSQHTISHNNQRWVNNGAYKLGDSRGKFENLPEQIKTKQVFFKTRNLRNLMAGNSSPSDAKNLPKYDTSKKKKKASIGKKAKSNQMLPQQSMSHANGFIDRLSKPNKTTLKSIPQFLDFRDKPTRSSKPTAISQVKLNDQFNHFSSFMSNPNNVHGQILNMSNDMMDQFDVRSKMTVNSLASNQKVQHEQDPREFQNIKIIQNLSPGQTSQMPSFFDSKLSNQTQTMSRDQQLLNKQKTMMAPMIDVGNFIHMDEVRDFGSPSEQKTPTALQMRLTKSRLGNNTLKQMIDQSQNNMNKSSDNLRDCPRSKLNKSHNSRSKTKAADFTYKTVSTQSGKDKKETQLFKINRSAHFAEKMLSKQIQKKQEYQKLHSILREKTAANDYTHLNSQQMSTSIDDNCVYKHNQQNQSKMNATIGAKTIKMLQNDGPLDNYTYNLHILNNLNQTVGSPNKKGRQFSLRSPTQKQSYLNSTSNYNYQNQKNAYQIKYTFDRKKGAASTKSVAKNIIIQRNQSPSSKKSDKQKTLDQAGKDNQTLDYPGSQNNMIEMFESDSKTQLHSNRQFNSNTNLRIDQQKRQYSQSFQMRRQSNQMSRQKIKQKLQHIAPELHENVKSSREITYDTINNNDYPQCQVQDVDGDNPPHSGSKRSPSTRAADASKSSQPRTKVRIHTSPHQSNKKFRSKHNSGNAPNSGQHTSKSNANQKQDVSSGMKDDLQNQDQSNDARLVSKKQSSLSLNRPQVIVRNTVISNSRSPKYKQILNKSEFEDAEEYYQTRLAQIDSKQNLTASVSNENMENSMLYDYIQKIDPCRFMSFSGSGHVHRAIHSPGLLDNPDGMDLKQLQRDLISTNQMCQRLITTYENQEPELNLNEPKMTQVYGNSLPTVVKCRLNDLLPPLRLSINYSLVENFDKVDLSIFYSFSTKEPSSINCVQSFVSKPKQIVIHAKDMEGNKLKKFEQEMVFISFSSEVGCTLELTVRGISIQMQKKLKLQQQYQGSLDISKMPSSFEEQTLSMQQISNLIPKTDPYYQEMLSQQKDLETKIKSRKNNQQTFAKYIFNHPFLKEYHKEQAAKNREKIAESNYIQNVQFLQKWSIYKQVKAICIKKKNFAEKKKEMVKLYVVLTKLNQLLIHLSTIYKQHMAIVSKKERSIFISLCVYQAMKRQFKHYGPNIETRTQRTIKCAFEYGYLMHNQPIFQKQAKKILTEFLRYHGRSMTFAEKAELTMQRVIYIQGKYRLVTQTMRSRRAALRGPILDKQTFFVLQQVLKQGKEDLYKAIQNLSEKKKDFITDCIIMLAKFDFRRQFMDWYVKHHLDVSTEQGQIKQDQLKLNIKKARAMSKLLVNWIAQNRIYGTMHICPQSRKSKINVDEEQLAKAGDLGEVNLKQQFQEQLKHKIQLKKVEQKIEQATEEKQKNDLEVQMKTGNKANRQSQKQLQKIENQQKEKKEQEMKDKLASVIQNMQKKVKVPSFAIYSRLDKDLLKALLIKCTEIEDYELEDLKDVYFNPERAEQEGQFGAFLDELGDDDHTGSHGSTHRHQKKDKDGSKNAKKKNQQAKQAKGKGQKK